MTQLVTDEPMDDQDDIAPDQGEDTQPEEHPDEVTNASSHPAADLDPDLEREIKRVIVEEEPAKPKAQVLPDHLIHKALEPDDLYDAGSI